MQLAAGPESMHLGVVAKQAAPGLWIAFALNGFFLYLGALDLVGIEPEARITGPYYVAVGTGLGAIALARGELLLSRLGSSSNVVRIWAFAAVALASWFLVTATLRSDGDTARDAAFLLVVLCVPSALAVLALRTADAIWLAVGLVTTGLLFSVVSLGRLMSLDEGAARFSPIDELNPITAAATATLGALGCLALRPASRRGRVAQAAALVLLAAAAVVPGARGPLLALAVGALAVAALTLRHVWRLALPALAAGIVLGLVGAEYAGSTHYLGVDVPYLEGRAPTGADFTGVPQAVPPELLEQEPISTTEIRRTLLRDAVSAIPDRPLLGHGVGMLRDESEGTRRLVEAGRIELMDTRTHPHNVLVESAYSLGLIGLTLFLTLVAAAGVALTSLVRSGRDRPSTLLVVGFAAAAAVMANLSGELGMDAYVWVALALPLSFYAARREAEAQAR